MCVDFGTITDLYTTNSTERNLSLLYTGHFYAKHGLELRCAVQIHFGVAQNCA